MAQQYYDPDSGEPIQKEYYDPDSGEPVAATPKQYFDPSSGEPIAASVTTPEPEEPGMLGKAFNWATTPLVDKYKNQDPMNPYLRLGDRLGAELTTPLSIVGELVGAGAVGMGIRRLRQANILGKVGKAASAVTDVSPVRRVAGAISDEAIDLNRLTPEQAGRVQPLAEVGETVKINPITGAVTEAAKVEPVVQSPQKTLIKALGKQADLNKQQREITRATRAERFAKAGDVETRGKAGAQEFMGKLAGKHERLSTTPLDVTPQQLDDFNTTILDAAIPETIKARAIAGLSKIEVGAQAQRSERLALREVFGDEVGTALDKNIDKGGRVKNIVLESLGLARGLKTMADLSFMLRQGVLHAGRAHWRKAFIPNIRALASEGYFQKANQGILRDAKNIDLKKKAGLAYTDLKTFEGREEAIMSTWVEKIPSIPSLIKAGVTRDASKLKPGLVSRTARASNRAYTLAGNIIRDGAFDVVFDNYSRHYNSAKKIAMALPDDAARKARLEEIEIFNPNNPYRAKKIAEEVNVSTGRGGLGKLEAVATELNAGFFSPRLISSRVRSINRTMNPISYIRQDPVMRKEHLKQLLSLVSMTGTTAGLTKMMGGEMTLDPRSSDFLKGKIGRVRFDLLGGIPQYIVPLVKAATNTGVSTRRGNEYTLGEGMTDDAVMTLAKALMYKAAPIPGFLFSLLRREDPIGRPLNLDSMNPMENKAMNLAVPMVTEDLYELMKEDPGLIPILMPLSVLGGGVQVHEPR